MELRVQVAVRAIIQDKAMARKEELHKSHRKQLGSHCKDPILNFLPPPKHKPFFCPSANLDPPAFSLEP